MSMGLIDKETMIRTAQNIIGNEAGYKAWAILDAIREAPEAVVRCKDCKHGSLYCTEDICGETLIECNRPDLGDTIEIHGWKWFCADGERR